jgi:hypothetical protein
MAKPQCFLLLSIMHATENEAPGSRVPVSTSEAPCPGCSDDAGFGGSTSGVQRCGSDRADCPVRADGACERGVLAASLQRTRMRGEPGDGGGGAAGDDSGVRLDGYTAPVTASPYDPWHSEEYLLGCLVRLHGWFWLRPRVLAGPWRRTRVHSFMQPEGE